MRINLGHCPKITTSGKWKRISDEAENGKRELENGRHTILFALRANFCACAKCAVLNNGLGICTLYKTILVASTLST